jgi:protein TonB
MFESVKTLDNRPNGLRYFASLLVSVAVHAAILGLIVLIPLVFCHVLPTDDIIAFVMADPLVPPPPPVPTPPVQPVHRSRENTLAGQTNLPPITIPKGFHPEAPHLEAADIRTIIDGLGGPPTIEGTGAAIEKLFPDIRKVAKPKAPDRPKIERTRIKVSGTLQQSKLIHRVDPVYPRPAIITHTTGSVILEAIIDEDGNVMEPIKVLSGPPLLVGAAVDAVRQWKYSPTILGGEPMQVVATITVIFRLK